MEKEVAIFNCPVVQNDIFSWVYAYSKLFFLVL